MGFDLPTEPGEKRLTLILFFSPYLELDSLNSVFESLLHGDIAVFDALDRQHQCFNFANW
jgi:hypothetical protein